MKIKNKNKKAELQVMETIIVVIIILVMILLGMGFFYRYLQEDIKAQSVEYAKQNFDAFAFTLPQQAEFSCSKAGEKENCLDGFKMIAFSSVYNRNKGVYEGIFGFKNISVEIVYPIPPKKGVCRAGGFQECSLFSIYSNIPGSYDGKRVISMPVSVYLPWKKTYAIGILRMEGYNIGIK